MELLSWEYKGEERLHVFRRPSWKQLVIGFAGVVTFGLLWQLMPGLLPAIVAIIAVLGCLSGFAFKKWRGRVLISSTGVIVGTTASTWDNVASVRFDQGKLAFLFKGNLAQTFLSQTTGAKIIVPVPRPLHSDVEELCAKLNDMIAGRKGDLSQLPAPVGSRK